MAEKKKTITVKQQVKELIFDIQNKTYLTGQAKEASGVNYEATSYMQASDDNENSYQIRRSLSNVFSTLKSQLGEYIKESKTTSDNMIKKEIDEDGELSIAFEMPSNFNEAAADSIGNNIHSYLVDKALCDWFSITSPGDVQIYEKHSEVSLEAVKRALYKRSRPTRPTFSPG